jgi:hypothetical protein
MSLLSYVTGFFNPAPIITLKPDDSGKKIAGFREGSLKITADFSGQNVRDLLEKINKYRGPDQQIKHVWDNNGTAVNPETAVTENTVFVIRADSV